MARPNSIPARSAKWLLDRITSLKLLDFYEKIGKYRKSLSTEILHRVSQNKQHQPILPQLDRQTTRNRRL